ncbi:MAG: trans-aconitate 2-methyltransferase [Xanthobacteraceae bacterium]
MEDWNARQYLKFEDERTRPPRDLLAQVPLQRPRLAVDLGCGPGNSTDLLIERFPQCEVIGLDSSPDMLRKARERLPKCKFIEADIATWVPEERTDLLFANAALQWVPDHSRVLRRLLEALPAGGVLAVQMPDNTQEPANVLQREVAGSGPWAAKLAAAVPRADMLPPDAYYDLLKPVSAHIDIWHSVYNHAMANPQAIVEWFKGSSLQPYLSLLDAGMREQFLSAYTEKVVEVYKPRLDGKVLLKFPRLFIVAVR